MNTIRLIVSILLVIIVLDLLCVTCLKPFSFNFLSFFFASLFRNLASSLSQCANLQSYLLSPHPPTHKWVCMCGCFQLYKRSYLTRIQIAIYSFFFFSAIFLIFFSFFFYQMFIVSTTFVCLQCQEKGSPCFDGRYDKIAQSQSKQNNMNYI